MGRLEVRFQLSGETEFARAFDNIKHIPDDFRGAWEPMAEDFWKQNEDTFAAEGPGWAPLAPATRWDRLYHGYPPSHPILVRSGALKDSLTDGTADGAIYEVYPREMSLGTELKTPDGRYTLGMLHQTGTRPHKNSPHGMPARPPVVVTPELKRKWNKRLEMWLRDELNYQG